MLAINMCRRCCGIKYAFCSSVSKTASTGTRRKSDGSSKINNGKVSEEEEASSSEPREAQQKKGNKLYTVPENTKDAKEAQIKLLKLIMEAKCGVEDRNESKIKMAHPQEKKKSFMLEKKDKFPDERLGREIFISAKKVAQDLGGNVRKTQDDLLTYYNSLNKNSKGVSKSKPKRGLNEEDQKLALKVHSILHDINKVERVQEGFNYGEGQQWAQSESKLNDLNIFNKKIEWEKGTELLLWDRLEKYELKYLGTISPRNFYEEMILWTEQGRLWHFPIDNEQGMDDEAKISFSEHVFLEHKLQPWCPKSGPLRHFMELVLVGLSKNYHLTVEQKHEHIDWFRDYFENKRKLLTEVGAFSNKPIST